MTKKPNNKTASIVSTQNAAARAMGVTAKTIGAWKAEGGFEAGFLPDGSVNVSILRDWVASRIRSRAGSADSKEQKLLEEIRKLKIANDSKEGALVARAWVAERIQRAAGELNAARTKSEAEHPMRFAAAAGDVAGCRTIVRGIWDDIFTALQSLSKHFEA